MQRQKLVFYVNWFVTVRVLWLDSYICLYGCLSIHVLAVFRQSNCILLSIEKIVCLKNHTAESKIFEEINFKQFQTFSR